MKQEEKRKLNELLGEKTVPEDIAQGLKDEFEDFKERTQKKKKF
jgi:hypothetical protein